MNSTNHQNSEIKKSFFVKFRSWILSLTSISPQNSELNKLLFANFNAWVRKPQNLVRINHLTDAESLALFNLLEAEINSANTYNLRAERFSELYAFNFDLNSIASELIEFLILEANQPEFKVADGSFLGISLPESLRIDGVSELKNNGYWIAPISISKDQIQEILEVLRNFNFNSRSTPPKVLSGEDLLSLVRYDKSPDPTFGDTYWAQNQNEIVRTNLFNRLAFDPFILSIANGYLGCPPIHDQINIWFSFPTKNEKINLANNAQLFHQDKDFIKFLKVFIYLTDVDEENGPHSYVEASHKDPMHDKDIPLHTKVGDDLVESIYGAGRIKTILGKSGTIVFADTSCAHKGHPVISGSRIMLQLEYTTSLYLSQVSPFADLDMNSAYRPAVSDRFFERITASYSSKNREIFSKYESDMY